MEICRLEHICKNYSMGEVVTVLKDISIQVNSGDFIAIEGPSGVGKSTLLYVIGTLLQSDQGTYMFGDTDVFSLTDKQKSEFRGKKIGFMFQDSTLIQALTLRENLFFFQKIYGKKDLKKVDEMLDRFGLLDRADFFPYQLSGGQRRRAMAARCFLNEPTLILADEPTNDLDEHWSEEIIRILKEQTEKGAAVIMVTHNSKWTKQATRQCVLEKGMLVEQLQ